MSYLPQVAWSSWIEDVLIIDANNYSISLAADNQNEPGATLQECEVGFYIRDNIGNTYKVAQILSVTPLSVKVFDELSVGVGPQENRLGYVYKSVGDGTGSFIAPIPYNRLSPTAFETARPIELDVLWKHDFWEKDGDDLYHLNIGNVRIDTALKFETNYTPISEPEGLVWWNLDEDTLNISQQNGVVNQVGAELSPLYKNQTGTLITDGTPVMFAGSVGASGRILIQPAIADDSFDPEYTIGIATEEIADGADGHVTWFGKIRGIDTTGTPYGEVWADGDILFISPFTAGYLTKIEPNAPNRRISVAVVVKAHASTGALFVRPTWRGKMQEMDDVDGTPLTTDGQFLVWNNTEQYFDPTHNINNYLLLQTAIDSGNPTGFTDNDSITVSYDYINRTITLTGTLDYYWQGTKKTLTSPWTSSPHTATLGSWYLYSLDGTNFVWSQIPWSFYYVQIAYVHYGATAVESFATREVHGLMDIESHVETHSQIGTHRISGGNATAGTYILDTDTDAAITPGFDLAVIKDEDNSTTIPAWIQGTYSTMYINSTTAESVFSLTESFPFLYQAASYIKYNNPVTGALVTGQINRYYNVYQILIPVTSDSDSQKYRTIFLQSQVEHTSLGAAIGEDVRGLSLGALANLSPEFVFWARLTYYSNASYSTTGKVELTAITYVTGNRANQITVAGFNPSDHGALSGLLDDDHTQYPLLLGRATGQTLIGGTGITDALNLQGTAGNGTLTSPAINFLVGNNGATNAGSILNNGNWEIPNILKVDTINEYTATNGVWIDGLGIKDTGINFEVGATTRIFKDGSNNLSFTDAIAGTKTLAQLAAGSPPGGSNTHVQFNDSGVFGGVVGLVFNKTSNNLTALGLITGSNIETNSTSLSTRIGIEAGINETESSVIFNTYIGYRAGYSTTTGSTNIFIGANAGYNNTTGYRNIFIGKDVGINSTGANNIFIGGLCAPVNTTGYSNLFIGVSSGYSNTVGRNNTYLGSSSGFNNISGISNLFIGESAGFYETGSNKLFIDNQDRTTEALGRTNALIYGLFDATVTSQTLRFNANVTTAENAYQTRGKYSYHQATLGTEANDDWRTYFDANRPYIQKRVGGSYVSIQTPQALTQSTSTLTWDVSDGYNARVTLTASITTFNFSGAVAGDAGVLTVVQGGSGSYTLAEPSGHIVQGGSWTLRTAVGSKDILAWYYDGTDYFWNYDATYA